MSELELLRKTIGILDNIRVPTALTQEVAVPIVQVSEDLKALYNAILETMERQKAETEVKTNV